MYIGFVALTMVLLPLASILLELLQHPSQPLLFLVGRWFVFWGVGVRLGVAGLRQFLRPAFTAKQIFHMSGDEALPLVRELGVANIATGAVGLLSLGATSFTLPIAISAGIFYGAAGIMHLGERSRSLNENVAMASDLFIFAVLAIFVAAMALVRP